MLRQIVIIIIIFLVSKNKYKPVDELARTPLRFKRPTLPRVYGTLPQQRSDDSNDTMLISRRRRGLAYYALLAAKQGWQKLLT